MPASNIERRYTLVPVELRARGDKRAIGGYAAVFSSPSQNLGGFVEVVERSFFNKSRGDGWPDVMARYNHDDNMLLGTTGGGTLRLEVDDTGLLYEVDVPSARADVMELVERGDVRKSSFAFRAFEDDWTMTDQGFPQRTLVSGQLVDVAPVNVPAYESTSVSRRSALGSLAEKMEAEIDDVLQLAEDGELRKFFVRTDADGGKPQVKTFGPAAVADLLAKQDPAV